ncbi:hypothetical protein DICVIV_05454 [Dictyocaulus viviparus]|uniref:SAM domain-containing protein n=1 Tax=Dictyocaulus viviparus TaxID=29172 RepID=A0A0D8XVD3_DICVI|nr:hypothetical protein DICVIV_05454 [Dictyocaulus viviparus]
MMITSTFEFLFYGIYRISNVPAWLKSLRLHKYTSMFAELTYEQMMALNEAELERRNRLSLSNPQRCLRCAIATLRQIITTPIIPYTPSPGESSDSINGFVAISSVNDQNLPGLIFNLLDEVQRAVFVPGKQPIDIEYEYLLMLFTIFDRLCVNEAFTHMQRQRVHQWKRLARKAIRPVDVRRRRVGLPHSGKCENCHYKDFVCRENKKMGSKSNGASLDKKLSNQTQQYQMAHSAFNKHLPLSNRDWSQFARNSLSASSPSAIQHHRKQHFNSGQWNPSFYTDCNNILRTRSRQMTSLSAQVFTQNLPQYRSQRHFEASESTDAVPLLSVSSHTYEGSSRWPRAIYGNNELLIDENIAREKFNSNPLDHSIGLWESLAFPCSTLEHGSGDLTSGYCSSTSEHSSGAGSPRTSGPGQTLYDRVCRDMAVLQLSI